MEDLDDNISSTGFEPLFINEDEADPDRTLMEQRECNTAQSGLTFTGTQLNQTGLIKPYLQEMDDLLKNCEKLTGIPFGSHLSANYNETSLTETTLRHSKEEDATENYGETSTSRQAYLSTSYIDTKMDGAGTEDQPAQGQLQGLGNRCGVATDISCQREMPLTSAGNKLSDTMMEYEGQLLGMLAMLESCMEEAGMDFEPQDWASDASQEYVHIGKNPHLCRGTTLVPIQEGRPMKLETQKMHLESWASQQAEENEVSKQSRNEVTIGSATNGSQQNLSCDVGAFSMESLERQGDLRSDRGVLDSQLRFSGAPMPLDSTEDDPMYCEATKTGYMSTGEGTDMKGEVTGIEVDDAELPARERQKLNMDTNDLGSGMDDLGALGSQMEKCIVEVQRLENRRKELLVEVVELRGNKDREEAEGSNEEQTEESIDSKVAELMNVLKKEEEGRREERKKEIQILRDQRAEEEKRMWKVNLERQGLQEELRKLKRRLFTMARDCAYNQVALNTQNREVELLKRDEEKLQSLVLQLTEEGSQLRTAQKQQLLDLQAELHAQSSSQTSNTQEDLTECRRHSCGDIQQYLQGGLKALEDRYEPILLTLLKRREATAGALVKAKEQAQELKAQLRPLKEEIQKLKLQGACLEEKLKLIHLQRREEVGQYKETVYCLEESSRELKTELNIQKRKTKEIEELRDSLTKQLLLYRAAIEDHNKCNHEETT
ncbi:caldesmon-like isoform X1 [Morone saxatilis]|uniref:caldesmon-like isoform X1 n=1 Tax=Morone saxatilis TaxID=34816 RepID=UPI0015E223C5|nr:caldesmon-like isoform X1 [Morone saxatilis]XP_035536875.1 caldesmon-like isoform X1 [Morone saxatilis]